MVGLLLVNVGTPESPTPGAVRAYLRGFLGDSRVIEGNALARWLLVNLIIAPARGWRSAAAYRRIWTERGSPLLVNSRELADTVATLLGEKWRVEMAMRYGQPSIPAALAKLRELGVERLVVLPLFPQYASATTGSAVQAVLENVTRARVIPSLAIVPPFYQHPAFIAALTEVSKPVIEQVEPDHVLLSYHGLPERHLAKICRRSAACCAGAGTGTGTDADADAGAGTCSEPIASRFCYRAHCLATSQALRSSLGLIASNTSIAFQSRLGRSRWIGPHTDSVIVELAKRGVRKLVVICPSFVADCLETLDEIAVRGRRNFLGAGGEELQLVPSLNAHPAWASAAVELVRATTCWSAPGK
ncbi:MAG: ferrochelatase [Pseudomonadota bacterium]